MELLSIRTARFIGRISTSELNPRGLHVYPALVLGLVEKYGFAVTPDAESVFDEEKGVIFEDGAWGNVAIDKVSIFSEAIVIDTRSSTADSEAIFHEALTWASETYGITYSREMVSRRFYVSEVTVRTEKNLSGLNPKLELLGNHIAKAVRKQNGLDVQFEPTSIGIQYDISDTKMATAPFRFERLEGTRFSENKYYSVAPLTTDEHLEVLGQLENILSEG